MTKNIFGGKVIMTDERFNSIVTEITDRCKKTLIKKKNEYNFDADRLSAFKNSANYLKKTPEEILMCYRAKHEMSVVDLVNSKKEISRELMLEKICDNINYLILLAGLLEDDGLLLEDNELTKEKNKEVVKTEEPTVKKTTKVKLVEGK